MAELQQHTSFDDTLTYFTEMLSDKTFRLILLWDLLNHFDDLQVKRLFQLIKSISDADSYIHCIMHIGKKMPTGMLDYRINENGELQFDKNAKHAQANHARLDNRPLNVCYQYIVHDDNMLSNDGREMLLTLKKSA